jgi:hypothetical protein
MRIIDISSDLTADGKLPFSVSLRKIFTEGFGWKVEVDARNQVTTQLTGVLGPEFTLLRDAVLPGLATPIPLILLGPPGIYVLFVSALKGTFRARGDVWLALDSSGNMHPVKPNLPTRTRLFAEAIRKYLIKNGLTIGEVEAVLVFSRNDAFVENIKAPIRIVLADGIENYASSLRLSQPTLVPEQISAIIKVIAGSKDKPAYADSLKPDTDILAQAIVMPSTAAAIPSLASADEPSLREIFTDQSMARQIALPDQPRVPSSTSKPELEDETGREGGISAFLRQTHLSKKQALFLAVFTAMDSCVIIILLSLAIYLLRTQ